MKCDRFSYLQKKKQIAKEEFESSCGLKRTNREKHQQNMSMDEEDSNSGEINYLIVIKVSG